MRKTRQVVWTRGKMMEWDAWDVGVPGLVIVHDEREGRDHWIAVHSRSGSTLGVMWSNPEAAVAATRYIGEMADWTRKVQEFMGDRELAEKVYATGDKLPSVAPPEEWLEFQI